MEVFLAIVSIISAILNVILFFKLWGMTNNVKSIKEQYIPFETSDSFASNYHLAKLFIGQEEATKLLKMKIMDEVKELTANSYNIEKGSYRKSLEKIKARYNELIVDSGYEIPIEEILMAQFGPDEFGEFKLGMLVVARSDEAYGFTRVIRRLIPSTNEAIDDRNYRIKLDEYRPKAVD